MGEATRYEIGPDDRIVSVDERFDAFARENGASELARTAVGTRLWEHLSGAGVVALYRQFLGRVRDDARTIHVPFRCDAPDLRRFMSLAIGPGDETGAVRFTARLLRSETREPVPLWDADASRDEGNPVPACAWCKRVRVEEAWIDAEDAVARLGLFERALVPDVTHGICEDCARRMDGLLKSD